MDLNYIFRQGDAVLIATFLCLIAMSVTSWYFIVIRAIDLWNYRRHGRSFFTHFWNSHNWNEALNFARTKRIPASNIAVSAIEALQQYHSNIHNKLGNSCSLDEFLVRAIRNSLNQASAKLENGLTVLASVGSVAPFIGLFGTVWGIYHALINIATKGNATLDTVAGPMGEALIATAAGLAAAIPAVLAYNAFVRSNRLLQIEMDGFAHDLHARLTLNPQVMLSTEKPRQPTQLKNQPLSQPQPSH